MVNLSRDRLAAHQHATDATVGDYLLNRDVRSESQIDAKAKILIRLIIRLIDNVESAFLDTFFAKL